ncbi:MAG: Uma2 family endonuclease [Anaerolineae bacterium]|nr:Uma2 family endonuclease [Anaerolineae bacterium]
MQTATLAPLREGERLTREEFERRYEVMPDVRAELIEGVVYMASPTKNLHAAAQAVLVAWAGAYAARTPGVLVRNAMSYRIDERSELQPDVVLMREPRQGGKAKIDADGFLVGAPELVIEVAVTSFAHDLGAKLKLYERAGVQEYLVWEAEAQRMNWWSLHQERYVPLTPNPAGMWCSQVFSGLCLDVAALARLDIAAVLKPYLTSAG